MTDVHTLKADLAMGESPRWHDGRLWLSDWGAQEVLSVDLEGRSEVEVRMPSMPFCFDWLADGNLTIVSGREGRLLRRARGGALATLAELNGISRGPWNEIVVDAVGNAYVNSIGFDFPGGEFVPGIIAVVAPDGSARQVAGGVAFPNGMVVTPDNSTLIVAESWGSKLTAFDIGDDGSLSNRRMWAELDGGAPDGICLDADGAIWYGDVPNRRCVRVAEDGEVLQTIELDHGCFACALGGADGRTLFMVVSEWPPNMERRTGRVLTAEAPAPAARGPSPAT